MMVDSVLLYGYFTSACVALRSERVIVMEPPKFEDDDWDCMCVLHLMLGRNPRVYRALSSVYACSVPGRFGRVPGGTQAAAGRSNCWIGRSVSMQRTQ